MTKILVIEDETVLREEVCEWLMFEDYEVTGAEDGVAGLEVAFRDPPDLIVCDIMMPRLDGYGVLLELRSNPSTATIPFIFTTAKVSSEDIRRGMVSGADDYITKPFTRQELLKAIRTRLDKKALFEHNHQQAIGQLQMALEQEHEQRLLKARMVGLFSHDFRNPLATIMSSISILRDYADRIDEEHRQKHLNRAVASVRQLMQMLDEMLFIAQADSEHLTVEWESVNIEQFLMQLIEQFQTINSATHTLIFESDYHDTCLSDARLLRQMTTNLISNAIKYSPRGGEIHMTLHSDNGQCIFTVQDHGIGIPQADQERLFNAFQRGSNVSGLQGTGLGLVIVKQAVDLLQGSIQVDSEENVGTTFTVYLPIHT